MAVSKRLRFEVLRRDNHACRYCGRAAPEVKLTVDHVVPTALGGRDEAANLVTACEACNSGKSASAPDQAVVDDVRQDALRWAAAMREVAEERQRQRDALEEQVRPLVELWDGYRVGGDQLIPRPADATRNLSALLVAGLPTSYIRYAIQTAMATKKVGLDSVWRYMCGICWREVDAMREETAHRVRSAEPAPPSSSTPPVPLDVMRWVSPPLDYDGVAEYGHALSRVLDLRCKFWATRDTVHRAYSSCWTRDHLTELGYRARITPLRVTTEEVQRWVAESERNEDVLCSRCCGDLIASGHA